MIDSTPKEQTDKIVYRCGFNPVAKAIGFKHAFTRLLVHLQVKKLSTGLNITQPSSC